jgi:hypothetical protein
MKLKTSLKTAHTSKTQKGMGDYYGTGLTAKIGKMVDGTGMMEIKPSKLKKPPRSLA